ncbi:hypothetical protein HRR83_001072 [Exophiala dermatitidis]|uniref:Uncharacterized protein n=1 Tax=Exophiala dermatitidis TaxID=5970 RepID=A0AAN6F2N7_EXODE|nr:hypothetical protein HRR74_001076 [Exophiala dermatitidis]KAJ4527170.1 hypothetical protein HRR73_001967 [Exophiala dermatitidis]KAJ4532892.1 hypothetical protein HRR76_007868 [Exophiala dermatitidis]KAJ4538838.1 hypothetical protein HRR77_006763 [Exophiala dermatitidis]KAJ4574037.1 hypothetical protein HRR79_003040 [Exophiala dermatitidis]
MSTKRGYTAKSLQYEDVRRGILYRGCQPGFCKMMDTASGASLMQRAESLCLNGNKLYTRCSAPYFSPSSSVSRHGAEWVNSHNRRVAPSSTSTSQSSRAQKAQL